DDAAKQLRLTLAGPGVEPSGARRLAERMAVLLQGALLVRHAPAPVADAFCDSRLAGRGGAAFGTLPAGLELGSIIARHTPELP
ncbi:MAG TPA: DNA alkylation response protein, partial [Actinomycetota bacterium]|nr:DNA alkylation response protein [Actinomycetota bacterium]